MQPHSGVFSRLTTPLRQVSNCPHCGEKWAGRGACDPGPFYPLFFLPGPALVVASAISLVSAQKGENSLILLLLLSPPNPLTLGFGGDPILSATSGPNKLSKPPRRVTPPCPEPWHTGPYRGQHRGLALTSSAPVRDYPFPPDVEPDIHPDASQFAPCSKCPSWLAAQLALPHPRDSGTLPLIRLRGHGSQ